jgi:hypothetical protein
MVALRHHAASFLRDVRSNNSATDQVTFSNFMKQIALTLAY